MPPKRVPTVSTGKLSTQASSESVTSAITGPGMREVALRALTVSMASSWRRNWESTAHRRGHTTRPSTHSAPSPSANGLRLWMWLPIASIWPKKLAGIFSMSSPSRSRTCESAMSTAMPLVKPMTTVTGTYRTSVPSRNRPSRNSSTPALAVEISRLATP